MRQKYHAQAQRRRGLQLVVEVARHFLLFCASAPLREILVPLIFLAISGNASAQTLLRWKLKPGDALTVEIEQDTDSQVGFSGKSAKTEIHLELKLAWKVTAATNDGFTIRQTVERLYEKLTTQDMGTIEYDSAAAARPTGQARELAESIKPLVGAEFELVMTPHGEISSVTPINDVAKGLFAAGQKTDQNAVSQAGLQQMLRRPLVVLPDKAVKVGDTWTFASDRATAAGPLKLETAYTLESIDDKSLAKIAMTATAQPGSGSKTTIKEHQHGGTILFSASEGRLVQIDQKQKLVTERPYRETTITVTLDSKQTTTVK
jgi:hypothetical protein